MGGRKRRDMRGIAFQKGAVAIWVAVSIIALMTAAFLAIETGRVYYIQRDLQRLASLAAVAGAQVASGCSGPGANGSLGSLDEVTTLVHNFIVANGGSATYMTGVNGYAPVELGVMTPKNGLRVFVPLTEGDPRIDSVRVNLSRSQPTPFTGFLTSSGNLVASAAAQQPLVAAFRLGTTVLNLDQGALNQLLSGLLGTNVNLTLLNYQQLLGATVSMRDLMIAAGVTDLSQLLSLNTNLPGALKIVGTALSAGANDTSAAAAGLLTGLAGTANPGASSNPLAGVLGNIGAALNPTVTDALAAVPVIDGLGLLTALGQSAANGGTISIPVSLSIPGLLGSGTYVQIIDPEQPAFGHAGYDASGKPVTSAQSSQVKLKSRTALSLTILGVSVAEIHLGLDVNVGNGYSRLIAIRCPGVGRQYPQADIETTTSTVTATIGTFSGSATANPPKNLVSGNAVAIAGSLVTIPVTLADSPPILGTTITQTAEGPFPEPEALPTVKSSGNLSTLISSLVASNLSIQVNLLLLPPVTLPLNSVLLLLQPLITVLDTVLDGLLNALGVGIGESGVTVDSISNARSEKVAICVPGAPAGTGLRGCP
jgi:uncharacterized membrane protein